MNNAIAAALGEEPADLLIRNARVVNVFSGEIYSEDVAVHQGRFLGFGSYPARERFDAEGRYLCPAFIEGHIHIESTLLSPPEFARTVASRGTGTVVCDPHEIANVLGLEGITYFLECSRSLPVDLFLMLPSCVPATNLETAGASLSSEDLRRLLASHPDRILGLAEMMNVPGVLQRDPEILARLEAARGRPIDGHCPGLTGPELNAYILAGPSSDHESVSLEEAREKLRKGMHLMIREGSSEKNLADLLPLLCPQTADRISLVTDDRHAEDLFRLGHLDHSLRLAIDGGVDPVLAIRSATLSTARYFGLSGRGAIAPGYRADFLLLDALKSVAIHSVYLQGRPVEELDFAARGVRVPPSAMALPQLTPEQLRIPGSRIGSSGAVKTIGLVPDQIVTRLEPGSPRKRDGLLEADPGRDLAKLAVVERYSGNGRTGLGFVRGLGLQAGALASSVAHDSHNCIAAGVEDRDMLTALRCVAEMGGGFAVVREERVLASMALPVAGLMSLKPLETVLEEQQQVRSGLEALGCPEGSNVFMALSFLALPVIPELRLTDRGLVDVAAFQLTGLAWEDRVPLSSRE